MYCGVVEEDLLPAGQGKANSWASVVGKLPPQRGNSKPNNNSRTLLRSSTVVNYEIDRIDANDGEALLRGVTEGCGEKGRGGRQRILHRHVSKQPINAKGIFLKHTRIYTYVNFDF